MKKLLIGFVTFVKNEGCDENSIGVITITEKKFSLKYFLTASGTRTSKLEITVKRQKPDTICVREVE